MTVFQIQFDDKKEQEQTKKDLIYTRVLSATVTGALIRTLRPLLGLSLASSHQISLAFSLSHEIARSQTARPESATLGLDRLSNGEASAVRF